MKTNYDTPFLVVDPRQDGLFGSHGLFKTFKNKPFVRSYSPKFVSKSLTDGISELLTTYSENRIQFFPVLISELANIDYQDRYNEIIDLFKHHIELVSKPNVIPLLIDVFETNPYMPMLHRKISELLPNGARAISADYNHSLNNRNIYYFNHWLSKMPARGKILSYSPVKTYVNLNRIARPHRIELMSALVKNDLALSGYNTWSNAEDMYRRHLKRTPDCVLKDHTFDVLDIENLEDMNPNNCFPLEACEESFLFLVTETNADDDKLFFSEKIFKPISIGMPFILLGNPGSLSVLKDMGFVTFDDWWDESYDDEPDLSLRIQKIIEIIKWIDKRSDGFRQERREEMIPYLEHNMQLYKLLTHKCHAKDLLTKIKKEWVVNK